jgi:adenylate cyclase class 2
MGIEIEKKYRLTTEQRDSLVARLREIGATYVGDEFEENTLYAGGNLDLNKNVLRLRRVAGRAILTYKERYESTSSIKHQREDETGVDDAQALSQILDALGFRPALCYEKRRKTWRLNKVEIVVDVLSFGLFMEIEGEEDAIREAERLLELNEVEVETATYPQLTARHGIKRGSMIEARLD